MTLILTVANRKGIYQSSDYQITGNGKFETDKAGTKQIEAGFENMSINLAFTGIAWGGGQKVRTIDFLSNVLKSLPPTSSLDKICTALADQCEATVPDKQTLTLILAIATVGKPFKVATISNTNWDTKPPGVKPKFDISIRTINRPYVNVEGYRSSVSGKLHTQLRLLSRVEDKPREEIMEELVEINAVASKGSKGYVSEKCWVTSFIADGRMRRGAGRNIKGEGAVSGITGGIDTVEWVKKNFMAAPGKELQLVQRASVIAGTNDGIPVPAPEGEPKEFTISGEAVTRIIKSPTGQELCTVTITPVNDAFAARCNEELIGEFADIEVIPTGSGMHDFESKMPFDILSPVIRFNDIATPRAWEQAINPFVMDGVCYLNFPFTSRGIRNAAFLGENDELVVVVPTEEVSFSFRQPGPVIKKSLIARLFWRKII
jgi:hypothetical protein